jgi:tetratricopeptide (TPR) repeat protein
VDRILGISAEPDDDADRALDCAGLAWIEGNEVMLSSLAELGRHPEVLLHLVLVLPEHAWLKRSGAAIHAAVPAHLPTLRAAWVIPDPPYSQWPAIVPKDVLEKVLDELSAGVEPSAWSSERYALISQIEGLRREVGLRDRQFAFDPWKPWRTRNRPERFWADPEPHYKELLDGLRAAFRGLRDPSLRAFDRERGTIHRFDALDLASAQLDTGPHLAAFVRWFGLTLQVDTIDVRDFAMFEAQIERGIELATDSEELAQALLALRGDIHAKRRDYRGAEQTWQQADPEEHNLCLVWRRSLACLRLGETDVGFKLVARGAEIAWDIEDESESDGYGGTRGGLDENDQLVREVINTFRLGHSKQRVESIEHQFYNRDTSLVRIAHAAVAIERGDWPRAVHFAAKLDRTGGSSMAAHAQVLWAWQHAALGDPDAAATSFDELRETAKTRGDRLLLALAERGWAVSATELGQLDLAAEAHARADALEHELGVVASEEP